jgi:hypothetical protein
MATLVLTSSNSTEKDRLSVPKSLLSEKSQYFAERPSHKSSDRPATLSLPLPNDVDEVHIYIYWLYRNVIDLTAETLSDNVLLHLFRLGEKFDDDGFRDAVMDKFIEQVLEDVDEMVPSMDQYHCLGHEKLQSFLEDLHVYEGNESWYVGAEAEVFEQEVVQGIATALQRHKNEEIHPHLAPYHGSRCFYHLYGDDKPCYKKRL